MCHADRAPGSNVTLLPVTLEGFFALKSDSTRTEPVKVLSEPLLGIREAL